MKLSKNFLKNFKKNDIVIYAIALMLVTAGYFNYTANVDDGSIETYSEDINSVSEIADANITNNTTNDSDANIGDAELVNSNDVVTEDKNTNEANSEATSDEESEEQQANSDDVQNGTETENSVDTAKETEESSAKNESNSAESDENSAKNSSSDYFVNSKLERDTNYASMISTYTKILEDESVSETQKSIAMKEITEINDTKNAISICENLLSTKGFTNSVILINDNSVNVVVEVDGGLTADKVAQVQNIISRELSTDIEDIHITENK